MAAVTAAEIRGAYARTLIGRGYGTYNWAVEELNALPVPSLRRLAEDIGIEKRIWRTARKGDLVTEIRRYGQIVEQAVR